MLSSSLTVDVSFGENETHVNLLILQMHEWLLRYGLFDSKIQRREGELQFSGKKSCVTVQVIHRRNAHS